jgi:pectin methylesterase-like acyl-CoA thioesterase
VVCFATRPGFAQDADKKPSILAVDDKVQRPTARFTSIQAAVNAAISGDVIPVCAGTYHEQVVIDKSLSVQADNGVIVIPGDVVAISAGASSGEATAASTTRSSPSPHSVFAKYPDQPAPIISATNTSPPSSVCRILHPQGA